MDVRLALALFALASCLPERHSLVGLACDESGRCPDGLVCVAKTCLPDAGHGGGGGGIGGGTGGAGGGGTGAGGGGGAADGGQNLLANGGFELGSPAPSSWTANLIQGSWLRSANRVRSGQYAGEAVNTSAFLTSASVASAPVSAPAAGRYCAEIFVGGAGLYTPVSLQLQGTNGDFGTPAPGGWLRLSTSVDAAFGESLSLRVQAVLNGDGGTLYLDDASLWRCP